MNNLKSKTLEALLSIDNNKHELKRLAALLLEAMQDWPTQGIETVAEFAEDLQSYFGGPLTIERLQSVPFDGQNAWHLEAGGKMVEFMNRAQSTLKIDNFDLALNKVLNFYCSEFEKVDFVAQVQIFGFESGLANSYIRNGYKQNIRFENSMKIIAAEINFEGSEFLYPGQRTTVYIKLNAEQTLAYLLNTDKVFEIRDAGTVIGRGEVKFVVNSDLQEKSWTDSFAESSIFMVL
jgi:hypothetical protein